MRPSQCFLHAVEVCSSRNEPGRSILLGEFIDHEDEADQRPAVAAGRDILVQQLGLGSRKDSSQMEAAEAERAADLL